jgi:multidrug transporter EmrE-like cation transporter
MNTIGWAVGSVTLSVAAQFALRHGMTTANAMVQSQDLALWRAAAFTPIVWMGLALYIGSAAFWLGVLSRWEVSKAYPLVGLGFVVTLLVGWALGEQVGALRAAGVVLIAVGVVLVAQS